MNSTLRWFPVVFGCLAMLAAAIIWLHAPLCAHKLAAAINRFIHSPGN